MSLDSKFLIRSFGITAFLIPAPVIIKGRLYVSNISVNIRIAWEDLSGDDFLVDRDFRLLIYSGVVRDIVCERNVDNILRRAQRVM